MSRELLERILRVLKGECGPGAYIIPLISEIEAELEKHDPKPTGYTGVGLDLISLEDFEKLQTGMKLLYDTPLYEHPPAQQNPLTIDEAETIFLTKSSSDDWLDLVRAIEKAVLKANGLMKGDL